MKKEPIMLALSSLPVREIMIKDVITIPQGTPLRKAADVMLHHRVGCVVIMDGHKPTGIITEQDFVELVKNGEDTSKWLIADDISPAELITVTPSTNCSKAFALLNTYKIKRLPVVQNGRLKGLLTLREMSVYSRNALMNALYKNRSLQREANQDELTGAYNKRYFQRYILQEYKHVQDLGMWSSLIFLDIDHFKKVNDTYSHSAGDYVLKELVKLLKLHTQSRDLVARYGGEEFVISLPYTKSTVAAQVANKIRVAVKNFPFKWHADRFQVTLSAGVASLPSASSAAQAIERADKALYKAKEEGRDQVWRWDSSTNAIRETRYRYKI